MRHSVDLPMFIAASAAAIVLAACGGSESDAVVPSDVAQAVAQKGSRPIAITPGSDVVAYWNQIATSTINVAPAATGTPEERRPVYSLDLATVQVAVFDAVNAIDGSYARFAAQPTTATAGASLEAAAAAAAYHTLKGLFPNRTAQYQSAYDSYVAALPDGDAKTRGLQIGQEVAVQIVALRADDGRLTPVTYAPTSLPGRFRGTNPVNTFMPFVRPFTLQNAAQFRADGPPPLTSTDYAADFNETKALGAANSTVRTAEQTEIARFHTEAPPVFLPRNLRIFAAADRGIAENARTMAALWTAHADAIIACFESKYHFDSWRPSSAITLADTDGNAATDTDLSWTPVVPTPNHPEYPAAHSCTAGSAAEVLQQVFGTKRLSFDWTSNVTGTTHHFDSTDDLGRESQLARIAGGMHFRTSTVHGEVLGMKVSKWVLRHHFQPVERGAGN
jgi:PAP2 superfamily